MSSQAEQASVRTEVVVAAEQEEAFRIFVERFDAIKPREHNMLQVEIAESVLEPREGGHLFDRGVDGSECRWGRVLAYEPPRRIVFSWDISPQWQLETDPAKASEVEVNFLPAGEGQTRVELEHRHLDRHGDGWESLRDGVESPGGWPLYLQRYGDLLSP